MGGFRNRSERTPFAPPSPYMTGHGVYVPGLPLDITWNKPMDVGSVPAVGSFEVVIDGIPETPTVIVWQDAVTLRFSFAGVPAVSGVLNQLVIDTALRGADMSLVKLPQSQTFHP